MPTSEGLQVRLDVGMLYHIVPDKARDIFVTLGEHYGATYIKPYLSSTVRTITATNPAEALYNSTRETMAININRSIGALLFPHGIIVESVLLKDIVLPKLLKDAIDKKTAAQQEAERMQFVIAKEKREKDRKKIEAEGIAQFQDIVSSGISPQLLQWKGIEATEKLAGAPNAKLVLMGNSKGSLPVLMSNTADANTV